MVILDFATAAGPLLRLTVGPSGSPQLDGDGSWLDFDFEPFSQRLGRPVSYSEDAQEWTRSLPACYAGSAVAVSVLRDDDAAEPADLLPEPDAPDELAPMTEHTSEEPAEPDVHPLELDMFDPAAELLAHSTGRPAPPIGRLYRTFANTRLALAPFLRKAFIVAALLALAYLSYTRLVGPLPFAQHSAKATAIHASRHPAPAAHPLPASHPAVPVTRRSTTRTPAAPTSTAPKRASKK